jgi:hypothetical protein
MNAIVSEGRKAELRPAKSEVLETSSLANSISNMRSAFRFGSVDNMNVEDDLSRKLSRHDECSPNEVIAFFP